MNQLIESLWAVFDDPSFHRSLSWIVILVAPIIAFSLLVFKPSTYGKLQGQKARFGPLVSAKWSWIVMESPNLILGWICWARRTLEPMPRANSLLLSWFIWHYIHRTIIYPLKLSAKSQFPIGIMVSAMAYTTINGYLQAQDFCRFLEYPEDHTRSGSFILGLALTIAGFEVTRQSDATLLRLRKTGKYQIPHGRLFEFVSCPHYFGELLEWTGFCIASKLSLATISFVLLTGSNLIPRAVAQHAWYHNKFKEDYPKDRKAIIPMIL